MGRDHRSVLGAELQGVALAIDAFAGRFQQGVDDIEVLGATGGQRGDVFHRPTGLQGGDDAFSHLQLVGQIAVLEPVQLPVQIGGHGAVGEFIDGFALLQGGVEGADNSHVECRGVERVVGTGSSAVGELDFDRTHPAPVSGRYGAAGEEVAQTAQNGALAAPVAAGEDVHFGRKFPHEVADVPQPAHFDLPYVFLCCHYFRSSG